ncbi:hypothetical protein B566_EDAN004855 [Ephemera danica]|nr:hypothetical protein B566_EDAN004855 [Ephemera danica]
MRQPIKNHVGNAILSSRRNRGFGFQLGTVIRACWLFLLCVRLRKSTITLLRGDEEVGLLPRFAGIASGVTVSDVCKTTYEEIKKDKKHRYVVFFIRDEKQIDVEVIGDRNASYDQFLEDLQKGGTGECRYGLFDFEYTHQCQGTSEASKKQKLFLMSWCPDTAKVKKKMLYSSSFDALKKSLVGVQKYIQATDLSEASQEAVEEKLRATDRQ